MSPVNRKELLSNALYTTYILRLVLNGRQQVVQGELIDVATETTQRFKNWNGLIRTLSNRCKAQPAQTDDIGSHRS